MHYVIGDVHGCFDEMMRLLKKIESQDAAAILYFVGDFIDRGPKVWEVLTWAMEHITPDGKYRAVRGNHEELALEWIDQWLWWHKEVVGTELMDNWTEPKPRYDLRKCLDERNRLEPKTVTEIRSFFQSLPYNRLVTVKNAEGVEVNYRIVHAWHYQYENIKLSDQKYANLWERNLCGNTNSGEIIVHGHTPNLPDEWSILAEEDAGKICYEEKSNSINVDGGCCYQKYEPYCPCMLCAICLETLEEFYPCTLAERFEEFKQKGYLDEDSKIEDFPAFLEKD